ncbi:hypothetical protein BpHYR1_045173 [Brachionus plicatilis]|uniref:Uncharacterized protein n=1 Tax=Brachionus plicatilis TaxID=10195 RepID=A0A3M7P3K1_BRAPC|nr:hypothetical protein BpHYR1_045173 [Brachionus plicatilis]
MSSKPRQSLKSIENIEQHKAKVSEKKLRSRGRPRVREKKHSSESITYTKADIDAAFILVEFSMQNIEYPGFKNMKNMELNVTLFLANLLVQKNHPQL